MADQYNHHEIKKSDEVEAADRGLSDFMGKKEEEGNKCEDESIAGELDEKVKVSEEDTKKHQTLGEKLQRSNSSSSSSDEEEIGEDGEKKKKKKGLKDKITEKLTGERGEEKDTNVPIEKCDDKPTQEAEEKKGFLDKIKEKLPGGKKAEEVASPPPTPAAAAECAATPGTEEKEKKGLLDKIKDKIPGYSKADEEKEKEKEKEGACN